MVTVISYLAFLISILLLTLVIYLGLIKIKLI
uniref:Cytochrome b6-f complex subunit 6 n=1 Tax=Interfilum terricola TaxID=163310 RepID=A0A097KPH8_9VIRI|nr:subunit VI of cytochrome b6/f complex [Interfilum terricola]AIT95091.1 subunit VI of cytochrome b6/f complex [Interfilum terricola]